MSAVLTTLGTMGAIIALGWLLGSRRTLGEHAPAVLARVVFTVATPCLLFVTVAHADLRLLLSRSALTTAISTAVVALIAIAVLRGLWRRPAAEVTVGTLAASYVNAGNLGLPLAVYLLGDAVAVVPTLLFQLLILAPVAFAVLDARSSPGDETAGLEGLAPDGVEARRGRLPLTRIAWGVIVRTARNPIIVGTVSGLVVTALPWTLPEELYSPFSLVGAAAAPLALVTFGMSLAVPRLTRERAPRRDLALAVALRNLVGPVLAWLVGTLLGLTGQALLAVVAMAALPTAQNVLVYAMQYGRGQALARDAGLATTILAAPALLVITALLG
ncbi:AEC family transporter [Cellulomonas timonensis]|uniref:AEC family transporter n=1 Tax=Cellulomonas timonensis TaxID=1689271 RepID=UPI000829F8B5|nr:AEC family transporter [Cellulomonas timonensis]